MWKISERLSYVSTLTIHNCFPHIENDQEILLHFPNVMPTTYSYVENLMAMNSDNKKHLTCCTFTHKGG